MSIKPLRMSWIVACVALAACVTRADISVSEIQGASSIRNDYQQVTSLTPQTPRTLSSGFRLFEVKTQSDLASIVNSKGLAFLYHQVKDCSETGGADDFYSDVVYKRASEEKSGSGVFVYYAAIPRDFRQAATQSREVMGLSMRETLPEFCIGLGAGSKGGVSRLQTNFVPLDL